MVQINFAQKQVSAKIVYYGPGMSGKTTNLEVIHQRAPEQNKGELTSISTDGDRTLFFDFMPLDLGTVAGMKTSFQIYTVPGQVYYNSTRKLVLQGVDGVVFVADSSAAMMEENLESLRNLEENLNEYGKSLASLPHVIQFNKRDLPDALSVEQLSQALNVHGAPCYEAIANTGQGVFPTLKALAACVLESIHANSAAARGGAAPAGAARPQPAPQAPLPQAAARQAPLSMAQQSAPAPVAAAAQPVAQAASARVQPGAPRAPIASLGQTGFRGAPQSPAPAAGYAPPPQAPNAAPLSATGMHPGVAQPLAARPQVVPLQPQMQMAQPQMAQQQFAQQHAAPQQLAPQPMGQQHAVEYASAVGAAPAVGAQPQFDMQPYPAEPQQAYAAPAPAAQLHLQGRAAQPSASTAPKNLRTGPVPAPLEGTRFRPRANGAPAAPRQEVRPTPARATSSKLFVAVFVVAGAILAAGLAYVAMSFL